MSTEYEYLLEADLSEHIGKWVAIIGKEVIASGVSLREVHREAMQKARNREPLFAKIPGSEISIL